MDYREKYSNNANKLYEVERESIEQIIAFLSQKELSDYERSNSENKINKILDVLINTKDRTAEYDKISEVHNETHDLIDKLKDLPDKKEVVSKRKKVEDDIQKFRSDCDKLIEHLNGVQASLVFNNELDLTDEVIELDNELEELSSKASELRNEIDEFRKLYDNPEFSMTVPEINRMVDEFKRRLRDDIKRPQIDRYNQRVYAINSRINKLKSMDSSNPEINELNELEAYRVNVSWNSRTYKKLDYNKLILISNKLSEIEEKLKVKVNSSYDEEINYIDNEIERIEYELGHVDTSKDDIDQVANNINSLLVRIVNDKDKLTEEEYNNYIERINDSQINLAMLNDKLRKLKNSDNKNDYKELLNRLNEINHDVNNLGGMIDALCGKVTEEALMIFETRLNEYDNELEFVRSEVEKRHNDGKLDDIQYQNLIIKIDEIKEKITDNRNKLKNPSMVKDTDIYAFLNKQIDGVEKAIDLLEVQVDKLEKPIKDKETRKKLDLVIDRIEKEIKAIEINLELHKENPEKYNELKERLDKQKERLDKISKNYRKKCPFLVKTVKSAKDFYKKHKKLVLIALGLAAIALIHATLGPVIIPAIMHGNLMMMHCAPALRGILGGVNNVLGRAINAKVINNIWTLANGVTIAPYCASASLLKGIAISGMGTAALVAPLVYGVKELVNKMNLARLKEDVTKKVNQGKEKVSATVEHAKEKINETKSKTKEKVDETKNKTKEKVNEVKDKVKDKTGSKRKGRRKILEELKELLEEYQKSKLSFEEFCEQNNLSPEDRIILENLNKKVGGR